MNRNTSMERGIDIGIETGIKTGVVVAGRKGPCK
jgi:hypothetical protein